jgi:hypothetical protein
MGEATSLAKARVLRPLLAVGLILCSGHLMAEGPGALGVSQPFRPWMPVGSQSIAFHNQPNVCSAPQAPRPGVRPVQASYFVKNVGQYPAEVLYYADFAGGRLYVRRHDVVLQVLLPPSVPAGDHCSGPLPMTDAQRSFQATTPPSERGNGAVTNIYLSFPGGAWTDVLPEDPQCTRLNYLKGNAPERWMQDVPTVRRLRVRNLFPEVDLVLEPSSTEGDVWHFEARRALPDPSLLRVQVASSHRVSLDAAGATVHTSDEAGVFLGSPGLVQNGRRSGRVCVFTDGSPLARSAKEEGPPSEISGGVGEGTQALRWATFLGGSGHDYLYMLAYDVEGNIIMGGFTDSPDLPAPNGFDQTGAGEQNAWDLYFAKVSATGDQLLWGTYIGGRGSDQFAAFRMDPSGDLIVAAQTNSDDMPTPGGFDHAYHGNEDIYLARLAGTGDALRWGTYLGGDGFDFPRALIVDRDGNLYIGGATTSRNLPTPGGIYTTPPGGDSWVSYVARIAPSGSMSWGSYFFGNDLYALAFDSVGNLLVGGEGPGYMPATTTFGTHGGGQDFYVLLVTASGDRTLWADRIFGNLTSGSPWLSLGRDSEGNILLVGNTQSPVLPTPNGFDHTFHGLDDTYVAKISATGKDLLWATYLGGSGFDELRPVGWDGSGNLILAGNTTSPDLPTKFGLQSLGRGDEDDMYIAKISSRGQLVSATYLAGSGWDYLSSVTGDRDGNLVVAAATESSDLPVFNGYQLNHINDKDMYLVKLAPYGQCLLWGTYLGGMDMDGLYGAAYKSGGDLMISGPSSSTDIPLLGGFDHTMHGQWDIYIAAISDPSPSLCTLTCGAQAPAGGQAHTPLTFQGTASTGDCLGAIRYLWDFGDGITAEEPTVTHAYTAAGNYTWSLSTTTDHQSCSVRGAANIQPVPNSPTIALIKKASPPFKLVVTGNSFQTGIKVYIDGVEWTSVVWKSVGKIQLTGGASLKTAVPKGAVRTFRLVNPDFGETTTTWGW